MFNLIFTIFYFCTGRLNRVLFFKSNIHIRISKGSKIKIGKNFSARQGSKIFAKRQSIIEIGDNVFFNHINLIDRYDFNRAQISKSTSSDI